MIWRRRGRWEMEHTMQPADLIDLVGKGGAAAVLVIVVWGFWSEKWVSGATYQRALKERDAYRDELLTTLRLVERATHVSERSIDIADSRLEAERRLRIRRRSEHEDNR